jgi:uncharacterized membrane protein
MWTTAGNSEFVARSIAVLLGSAAVWLMYALGVRLLDRKLAVVGALLLATSPFFIWYSQEARFITLAVVTSLLSMYAFHRAVVGGSCTDWLVYAIATTMVLLAFVANAFLVVAQGLYLVLLKHRRVVLPKWIAWQTPVGLIFGAWLLISYGGVAVDMVHEPATLQTGTPRELSPAVVPYTLLAFSSGFSMGPSVRELHISRELWMLLGHLPTLTPLTLLFGTLCVMGIVALYRETDMAVFLLLWLVIPVAGVLLMAATTDVAYNVRYACAAFPAYLFVLAGAIATLRRRVLQATVMVAVLCVNGISLANHYFNPRYAKEDTRAAARYLEAVGEAEDVIVVVGSTVGLKHYYKGGVPIVAWDSVATRDQAAIFRYVKALSNEHKRLWIVTIRPWEIDPKGQVQTTLSQWHSITRLTEFAGVEIYSYHVERTEQ